MHNFLKSSHNHRGKKNHHEIKETKVKHDWMSLNKARYILSNQQCNQRNRNIVGSFSFICSVCQSTLVMSSSTVRIERISTKQNLC